MGVNQCHLNPWEKRPSGMVLQRRVHEGRGSVVLAECASGVGRVWNCMTFHRFSWSLLFCIALFRWAAPGSVFRAGGRLVTQRWNRWVSEISGVLVCFVFFLFPSINSLLFELFLQELLNFGYGDDLVKVRVITDEKVGEYEHKKCMIKYITDHIRQLTYKRYRSEGNLTSFLRVEYTGHIHRGRKPECKNNEINDNIPCQ